MASQQEKPLVSIICLTYNHERFIAQAIEGFLFQKTSFYFEIIIHDDCSTDKTREVIQPYVEKFPNLYRLIYQDINQYSLGKKIIPLILPYCRGRYIALCEGDDYWIDPHKLQKQVDFLETNQDFNISFHRVKELKESGSEELSNLNSSDKEEVYTIEDLAIRNFIHTPSIVFRNIFSSVGFPKWFNESPVGDYVLHMLNARHGKIKYFPEPMAVYRIHSGGVWSSLTRTKVLEKWAKVLLLLILEFNSNAKVQEELLKQLAGIVWESSVYFKQDLMSTSIKNNLKNSELKVLIEEILNKSTHSYDELNVQLRAFEEQQLANRNLKNSLEYKIGNYIIKPLKYLKDVIN
ncbi:glycosyltransferase [Pontibacter sp. BT310]|uniref:Glycosyltransferase n=1 Tax=Pontibacter populi TaxID=890055 RepID=A0ABS6XF84_9BACT|nr:MULTISPECIES: glycosyltransferase [Pontibacter]MBJ6119789.1 glycosyltransferase [Pontibacter sp. BT310]MBR0572218.1 glycosyltransferase [Microvirga sp. STS03]MBW3366642.1 glycosyltransferase [Pontibacter populi]